MIRRAAHRSLWFKVLIPVLILGGMSEKWATLTVLPIIAWQIVKNIRDGHREQMWETPEHQAERMMTNLVYDNGVWVNPETPEQGIERLAGPYRVKPRQHAPHELAMGGR